MTAGQCNTTHLASLKQLRGLLLPLQVVGVLETQHVAHPLTNHQGPAALHGGLARAMSCLPDAQHHAHPWDPPTFRGSLLSRCSSAPPVPEVSSAQPAKNGTFMHSIV